MSETTRNVLVTGGASGIGRAVCLRLAGAARRIAVADTNVEGAESVSEEVRAQGSEAFAIPLDVTARAQLGRARERVLDEVGRIDILVNSAGIAQIVPFLQMEDEQWDRMVDVHLWGTYAVTRRFVPGMVEGGWGRVVNIASMAAFTGGTGISHYSAAKAGIIGFTRSLARELGPLGVTVNAVAPGMIDTPMLRGAGIPEEVIDSTARQTPVRRLGTPEDVAAACAFLVSEEASYFTAQVLSPNGGIY